MFPSASKSAPFTEVPKKLPPPTEAEYSNLHGNWRDEQGLQKRSIWKRLQEVKSLQMARNTTLQLELAINGFNKQPVQLNKNGVLSSYQAHSTRKHGTCFLS